MIDFSTLKGLSIPEGVVTKIEAGGVVLWELPAVPDTPTASTYLYGREADSVVSYNGVPLPDIDTVWTDKETYPYAAIFYSDSQAVGECVLVCSPQPIKIVTPDTNFRVIVYGKNLGFTLSDGEWTDNSKWVSNDFVRGVTSFVWSNADVVDKDNGTTYLATSDPVKSYSDPDVFIGDVGYYGAVLPPLPVWDECTHLLIEYYGGYLIAWLHGYPEKPAVVHKEDVWNDTFHDVVRLDVEDPWTWGANCYESDPTKWDDPYDGPFNNASEATLARTCWTNFDLYTSSGDLYLKATDPIPVSGLVGYSYNGTVLPELPEWDESVYPYAVIKHIASSGTTILYCANEPFKYHSLIKMVVTQPDSTKYLEYTVTDGSFTLSNEVDGEICKAGIGTNIIWTNTDIYNMSDTTVLFLAVSEPIPVYEKE